MRQHRARRALDSQLATRVARVLRTALGIMDLTEDFKAKVRICLDAKEMQGRPGWRTGIRPNHRIPGRVDETFIGMLTFTDREWLRPGECADALGHFIVTPADLTMFAPGFSWNLCEGLHVVGRAELVERLDA